MGLGPLGPHLLLYLLLPLIGTALGEATVTSAISVTDTSKGRQGQPLGQAAWTWQLPMADQRTLGICLHMYLERDFPEIERIVYPAPRPTATALDGRSSQGDSRVLVDGPGLEANCQQLTRLTRCFSRTLPRMQYYENFSEFRRLVVALDAVLLELCGAVDLMRHRFLPLLQTLNCMERVRDRSSCPYRDRLPPNIWHQLIRLEADSSLCWYACGAERLTKSGPLMRQLHCVRDSGAVRAHCGETAQHLFANLSSVFLGHWCQNTASSLSQIPFLLKMSLFLMPLLPLMYHQNI